MSSTLRFGCVTSRFVAVDIYIFNRVYCPYRAIELFIAVDAGRQGQLSDVIGLEVPEGHNQTLLQNTVSILIMVSKTDW